MEALKSIGMSLCITAVATSIFSMLIPNSNLEKVIKFAISLFFLTGIVSPFINGSLEIDFHFEDIEQHQSQTQFSEDVNKQFLNIAKSKLEQSVKIVLEKEDIKTEKIVCDINITQEDSISINKLKIYVTDQYLKDDYRIKNIVKKEVGVEAEVIKLN